MVQLIGAKEICNYIKRSEATFWRWVKTMDFPAAKVGGVFEADTVKIDKWKQRFSEYFLVSQPKNLDTKNRAGRR